MSLKTWLTGLLRGPSCEDCVFYVGMWCAERALVEHILKETLPPEASTTGRVTVTRAWQSCGGLLHRRRSP